MTKHDDCAARLTQGIGREFRRRLLGEYVPRIERCVAMLDARDLWRRPAPNCNSVGNLLLHLAGNTTQWILAGLGGAADQRDRPAEFGAGDGPAGAVLTAELRAVVAAACNVVDGLTAEELLQPYSIQGYREFGLNAVLHVLEHFSGHAGQIYAWTKQVSGVDLRFYDL